jgi:hypothetical protein
MSSSPEGGCWSAVYDGVRLRIKVQPKARRNTIDGVAPDRDGPVLKLAVNAPPEDGKANAAVVALLAEALGVAKAAVSVVMGATDRRKLVEIRGNSKDLGAGLDRLIKNLERNEHE